MSRSMSRVTSGRAIVVGLLVMVAVGASASSSLAAAPHWELRTDTSPTNISPSSGGILTVLATNVGGAPTNGSPVTITDVLPPGLTVTEMEGEERPNRNGLTCESTTSTVTTVTCTYHGEEFAPGEFAPLALQGNSTAGISVAIVVAAEPGTTGVLAPANTATVSGGGAAATELQDALTVSEGEPSFGFASALSTGAFDASGAIDSQAGDHPNIYSTGFAVSSVPEPSLIPGRSEVGVRPAQDLRDVSVELPVGFIGNPQSTVACPQYLVAPPGDGKECPTSSVVGSVAIEKGSRIWGFSEPASGSGGIKPLFNVTPEYGHPAQFAFIVTGQEATLYVTLVHTAAGYAVRVISPQIPRLVNITGVKVTFFGDPAAIDGSAVAPAAFFTNPTDCTAGALTTTIHADSWQDPGSYNADGSPNLADPAWQGSSSVTPPMTGCDKLQFHPELEVRPESAGPDEPSGLDVNLKIPQNADPTGVATSELKNLTVALPAGMAISPSAADGLEACSDEQFDLTSTAPSSCPEASTIGSATVHTPLLANPVHGRVFLGAPLCSPCTNADAESGRMVRMFIEFADPAHGVNIKVGGTVSVNSSSGQLTATFANNPELPFESLELSVNGGPRAPLATPSTCGTYTTTSDLTPWSSPGRTPEGAEVPGTPDAAPSSSFGIAGCASQNVFGPAFTAGSVSAQAGTFSPLTLSFSRSDADQQLLSVTQTLPPGLLARLAGVPQCSSAAASAGTCPEGSRIGSVSVGAGPGSHQLYVSGQIYLTGPYKGGPFGIAVVVPAIAGPFNLGTVVVRGAIYVDPHSSQATVATDDFPTILDGVPIQVRTVTATLDRPAFTFNPTSCNPMQLTGTVSSTGGLTVPVASRFQAGGCAALPFKPVLSASVAARASKGLGASLDVRVSAKGGPQAGGGEANIRAVKVDLPVQLPSRNSTLNKACLAAVFAANPANCPKESAVGTATAVTPVLANPLSGPAYLVSYGGEKFPDLEIVLQGEGIVLVLDGHTDIKKGVTSSDFNTVPDAPISSFEVKLPTGKFSLLTSYLPTKAKYDFCGHALTMPTMITAQNGAVLKQTTKIAVSGCPKAKKTVKKKTKKKATSKTTK